MKVISYWSSLWKSGQDFAADIVMKSCLVAVFWVLFGDACANILGNYEYNSGREHCHQLLKSIYHETAYESILLLEQTRGSCVRFKECLANSDIPKMLLTDAIQMTYKLQHNSKALAVVCPRTTLDLDLVTRMAEVLEFMRTTRLIVLIDAAPPPQEQEEQLLQLMEHCRELQLLNVLVLYSDYAETGVYHQYTPFPEFSVESHTFQETELGQMRIFPNRLRDLRGYQLRTLADHIEPRSMRYYNAKGQLVMNGYVGRFVRAFARKHKAQLVFPYNIPNDQIVFYRDVFLYMRNYSLDLAASVSTFSIGENIMEYSYPLEMGRWCLLLPTEQPIDVRTLYLRIVHSNFTAATFVMIALYTLILFFVVLQVQRESKRIDWPSLLVNDLAMRGVLGQSFIYYAFNSRILNLTYCLIFLTGLIVSTLFGSSMQSLLTQPPTEPRITTYDDILQSPLKVLISRRELQYMSSGAGETLSSYYDMFKVLEDFAEFSNIRDSFDRRYAYPMTTSKWPFYNGVQNFYAVKVMRYSSDLCPKPMLQFGFALSENSIFREPVEHLILEVQQSGLLYQWLDMSNADMLASGKKFPVNWSTPPPTKPLMMDDLFWIWIAYLVLMGVCIATFVFEVYGCRWIKGTL